MDYFLGEIRAVGFNFAPLNWALCNGQLLPISQNLTLYRMIGTTYGGDGLTNFALPNLQCRVPMGMGSAPGLSIRSLGQAVGTVQERVTVDQLPGHRHQLLIAGRATTQQIAGGYPAVSSAHVYGSGNIVAMLANEIGVTGNGQAHNNVQPLLVLNFVISLAGDVPSSYQV